VRVPQFNRKAVRLKFLELDAPQGDGDCTLGDVIPDVGAEAAVSCGADLGDCRQVIDGALSRLPDRPRVQYRIPNSESDSAATRIAWHSVTSSACSGFGVKSRIDTAEARC